MRKRALLAAYGLVSYLAFVGVFLYMIGFAGNFLVPKSIDSGQTTALLPSLVIDASLVALFGLQHTLMARAWFQERWQQWLPKEAERSTFVLVASLLLWLLVWQWRPLPATIWQIDNETGRFFMWALFWLGWGTTFISTFLIDHFDLFGLRQVYLHWRGEPYTPPPFQTPTLYRYVRHPMMLGLLIAFWATPDMTTGHFLFAAGMTIYILIGIRFEERDLVRHLGAQYREYRERTSMILPLPPDGQTD